MAIDTNNSSSTSRHGDRSSTEKFTEDFLESGSVRLTLIFIYLVTIILSVIGNFSLIVYIGRSTKFSHGNRFSLALIVNLAVCDLVRSVALSPIRFIELLTSAIGHNNSRNFCEVMNFFYLLLTFVGFHTVAAISQERLLIICYPFKAKQWLTARTVCLVLIAIWLCAFMIALTFALELSLSIKVILKSKLTYSICSLGGHETSIKIKAFSIFSSLLYYIMPVVIVVISYAKIFHFLMKKNFLSESLRMRIIKHATLEADNSAETNSPARHTSNRDFSRKAVQNLLESRKCLAKMMLVIAVCFAIFNGPTFFLYSFLGWGYRIQRNQIFCILIVKILPIMSSVINPLVYSSRSKILRRNLNNLSQIGCDEQYSDLASHLKRSKGNVSLTSF